MSSNFRTEYLPEYLVYLLNSTGTRIGEVFVSVGCSERTLARATESIAMERFQPARAELALDARGNPIVRMVAYRVSGIESEYLNGFEQ